MDELFLKFARGLFIIMLLFGAGMIVVILVGETSIGLKMLSTFASMFAGVLGLGSGYILGRSETNRHENGKEDP